MAIQITSPEVEALIQERLQTGGFRDPEDVILHALRASRRMQAPGDLLAALRSSPADRAPAWLQESWASAREQGLDRLTPEEIDAEIAAARRERQRS